MTLPTICAFLNMGAAELILVLIAFVFVIVVANYGRNTSLGYYGSLVLAIVTSPLVAFFIIYFFLKNKSANT